MLESGGYALSGLHEYSPLSGDLARSPPEAESFLLHKWPIFVLPQMYCGNTASETGGISKVWVKFPQNISE